MSTQTLSQSAHESFRYVYSREVAHLLQQIQSTLLVTTYQAGKLIAFHSLGDRISMLLRTFDRAMGLAVDCDRLALATKWQVWKFENTPALAPKISPKASHGACYLPRSSHITGEVDIHEIAWSSKSQDRAEPELWLVNTLFSCLCTLDHLYSFTPRWKPPFITRLSRHDRCHLNGMAMVGGSPRYVTVFARTDAPQGWRQHKRDGGCILHVPSGEVVASGFSMPHSPRFHQGRLWVLDSGHGRLSTIDLATGKADTVVELSGYTRGLTFHDRYAFIGLSRIRESSTFGGIPIADRPGERDCGVAVVDLIAGRQIGLIGFQGDVNEVFDVQLVPLTNPAIVGLQKDTIRNACVVGPEKPI